MQNPKIALYASNGQAYDLSAVSNRYSISFVAPTSGTHYIGAGFINQSGAQSGSYEVTFRTGLGSGTSDITFDDISESASANVTLSGTEIVSAQIDVSQNWLERRHHDGGQPHVPDLRPRARAGSLGSLQFRMRHTGLDNQYANDS